MLKIFGGGELVGKQYFEKSMKYFVEHAAEEKRDVIFIVVSDDIAWCKQNIQGRNVFYSPASEARGGAVALGRDLALLAASNHSVVTYGTLGQWGATLAGGTVIAADWQLTPGADHRKAFNGEIQENWLFF